jgi:glycosyltransferase involved in cell wall biosynthesis
VECARRWIPREIRYLSPVIRLSVVIITYNEERNIGRCLDAILDLADDIVVLDSFSTDRTEELCRARGVRFFQHAFDGHIEQKNRALTHAAYPHVFSLDADEVPDEKLKAAIRNAKQHWTHDGYTMNRLTNYCGKWIRHCGWYPDVKLRLWDSRKGRWSGTNPHDRYTLDGGATVSHLPGDLLHYSYRTTSEHDRQLEKFSTLGAHALFAQGRRAGPMTVAVKTVAKFIRVYLVKLGFLDGYYGWVIAIKSARESWLRYSTLRRLWREKHAAA